MCCVAVFAGLPGATFHGTCVYTSSPVAGLRSPSPGTLTATLLSLTTPNRTLSVAQTWLDGHTVMPFNSLKYFVLISWHTFWNIFHHFTAVLCIYYLKHCQYVCLEIITSMLNCNISHLYSKFECIYCSSGSMFSIYLMCLCFPLPASLLCSKWSMKSRVFVITLTI